MAPVTGEAVFARYAFPPNDLGHCGPPGSELLLATGAAGAVATDGDTVRARAPRFEGAWPYLALLASAAGIGDMLQADVVSAYWLGGELLDRVDRDAFLATVRDRFGAQPGVPDRLARAPDPVGAGPNHVFHVFVVYPWVGLLGTGGDVPRSVLDRCRVRWGTVESVDGEQARVRSRPLTWNGELLALGGDQVEICRWTRGQQAFVHGLQAGDTVSLHWDWVCDRLSDAQVTALATVTRRQLAATNQWLAQR